MVRSCLIFVLLTLSAWESPAVQQHLPERSWVSEKRPMTVFRKGVPTIGYGHPVASDEEWKEIFPNTESTKITEEEAERILQEDLRTHVRNVQEHVKVPISQAQFDALVSLSSDIGARNFANSSVVRFLDNNPKTKPSYATLEAAWKAWDKDIVTAEKKDRTTLSGVYGRYVVYEVEKYRGSFNTPATKARARMGQEVVLTATLFQTLGRRIVNPVYQVCFYPYQKEGVVPRRGERWSSFYYKDGGQANGDEVIEVYRSGTPPRGPAFNVEVLGVNELWIGHDGWYYKARKTTAPPQKQKIPSAY